jgi:hypothetical protein
MDEELTRSMPGEAEPDQPGLAERLIREEFGEPASVFDTTAQVTAVAVLPPAEAGVVSTGSIHEEFAGPPRPPRTRSHRTGMLAGLVVVGALLAVLVLLAPGSGKPRLPAQSVHDVSPVTASGPKTAAATTPSTAAPTTTTSAPGPSTTTTQPRHSVTVPTTVTVVYLPGTTTPTQAPTPTQTPATDAPVPPPTTSPPPPTTTPTTAPPTTTPTTHCLLGILCN